MTSVTVTEPQPRIAAELIVRAKPDQTIIAHGPMVRAPGKTPHRAVLRDMGHEWVSHIQCIDEESQTISFCWGNYFPKRSHTIAQVWAVFAERVADRYLPE
jgi:hypothetical protein